MLKQRQWCKFCDQTIYLNDALRAEKGRAETMRSVAPQVSSNTKLDLKEKKNLLS